MRFLVDENCDFAVVRGLREAGHDVAAVAELAPGLTDHEVLALAGSDGRIVITEDKGFGGLALAGGGTGVILARFPASARRTLVHAVVDLVARHGSALNGALAVIEPGRVRLLRS
jgi:predicted nuclease of predicted toxin-antitoxin system